MSAPLPPAMPGLPLLGNLLEYRRDHLAVFQRAFDTLGPVFSIRLGPQKAVVRLSSLAGVVAGASRSRLPGSQE